MSRLLRHRNRASGSLPLQTDPLADMQVLATILLVAGFLRWPGTQIKKRGKILRDTSAGRGLLIVEGQQYPFSRNQLWKSDLPPQVGMVVEAEFNREGKLTAIRTLEPGSAGASASRPAS